MISPSEITQELTLVKSTSLFDFWENNKRALNKPFWYRNEDGSLSFDFIREEYPSKEELLKNIQAGRIYIRKPDSTMNVTEKYNG